MLRESPGFIQIPSEKTLPFETILNEIYSKVFKECTNRTVTDFIHLKRIDVSTELLLTTDLSITTIAANVGYKDVGFFSRIFKKAIGISPKEYRAQNRK